MLGNVRPWELLILLAIILLLFGARRLPDLSRSVAKSLKIFKSETKGNDSEGVDAVRDEKNDAPHGTAGGVADSTAPDSSQGSGQVDPTPARSGTEPDDDGERPRG